MPTKTKKNNSVKSSPSIMGPTLNYKKSNTSWGLEATYEDFELTFSGHFTETRIRKEKIKALAKRLKIPTLKDEVNIGHIDLYKLFSNSAKHAWDSSYNLAKKRKSQIGVEDIFLALMKEPSVKDLLLRIKVDSKQAENFIYNYLQLTSSLDGITLQKIPFEAFAMAVKLHNHKIGSLMLLGGLLKATPHDNILQSIFTNIGLSAAKLELFSVWHLDLDHDFPPNSTSAKYLFCLRQASGLEQQFGYFFELPAIEAAVELSEGKTLIDLQHLKALQLLVKAGSVARNKGIKIISEKFVRQAAEK